MTEREDTHEDVENEAFDAALEEGATDEVGPDPALEIAELREHAAALEAQAHRMEADFINESKRLRRLAENDKKFSIEKVIVDLIPLIDSLHSAGVGLGESESEQRMSEGLGIVTRQLMEILNRHGVAPIEAGGEFDPNRHEALYTVPTSDVPPNTIVEVLRPGFSLHGRVVRPAEVAVSVSA